VRIMHNGSLSIAQAAEHLKVSTDTIRRRLKAGELEGSKAGRTWRVFLPESGTRTTESDGKLVAALEAHIESQGQVIKDQVKQIAELHQLLARAQTALPAPGQPWWKKVFGK